jgi:hypothetical protein
MGAGVAEWLVHQLVVLVWIKRGFMTLFAFVPNSAALMIANLLYF